MRGTNAVSCAKKLPFGSRCASHNSQRGIVGQGDAAPRRNTVATDIACALFAAGRISRAVAARIAGLDSFAFDEELFRRRIPSFTEEMLEQDLAALKRLRQQ
jgi:predicted HTH domain antitoxin